MILPTKIGLTTYVEVIQITPLISSFSLSNVILGVSRWQNPGNRFDVLGDGVVDINDYNAIINYITAHGSGPLPRNRSVNQPYVDVNGDGSINSQDATQLLSYLQNNKVIDTTPTKNYDISDFKIQRDLVDPATVSTVKDVAACKNIFPTGGYLVFLRDLSTNDLTAIDYSAAVSSRDSLVFVSKQVIVPVHPYTPGCYNESCVFRLIKARIAQSEILPIRFNKMVSATGVEVGTGLPMPGTDTSELPTQPTVPTIPIIPPVIVIVPPVVLRDLFPSPCVIIGEIKFVCTSTHGDDNASTTACTAQMTSNTAPPPYVVSADSEAVSNHPTYLAQYTFRSFYHGVQQIATTLDPTTSDFYHWIGGDFEINWALAGGDDPSRMAGFIDPRTIPGAYMICLEDQPPPRDSVFDSCVLVVPQPDGTIRCSWNGASDHIYIHKLFGPDGNVLFDPFGRGDTWSTWDAPAFSYFAWKAFNRTCNDASDQWESMPTASPHFLQYDFVVGAIVNKYAIQQQNSANHIGFPADFTLQGSNGGASWTVLDTRTSIAAPGPAVWTPYFTFNNGTAYRYYKLVITAVVGGGAVANVAELKLVCTSISGDDNPNTAACTAIMASNSVPTPNVVSASSEYYSAYRNTYYSAWKAFNTTNLGESDRWISSISTAPWYIEYDFGAGLAVPINKYAIQEQNYNGTTVVNGEIIQEQNYNSDVGFPQDFTLQGSNDNVHWTTLDTRTNIAAPGMNNWSNWFTFSNGTIYRYYRILVTTVNGQLPMPITATPTPTPDCVIVSSAKATIRGVVITQYYESERTTPQFRTAGQIQTTLYSNQDLVITFNAYDVRGVFAASLWLDGVYVPIATGPNAEPIGGVNFGVAIGKRAPGVHNYTIVATNSDGVSTSPPYTCWFTILQGGA